MPTETATATAAARCHRHSRPPVEWFRQAGPRNRLGSRFICDHVIRGLDGGNEPIAAACDCFHVARCLGGIVQHLAKPRNRRIQAAVEIDEGALGPEACAQLFARDHFSGGAPEAPSEPEMAAPEGALVLHSSAIQGWRRSASKGPNRTTVGDEWACTRCQPRGESVSFFTTKGDGLKRRIDGRSVGRRGNPERVPVSPSMALARSLISQPANARAIGERG